MIKDFVETERRNKQGKTELRLKGLTGHEAAEKVASAHRLSQPYRLGNGAIGQFLGQLGTLAGCFRSCACQDSILYQQKSSQSQNLDMCHTCS